MIVVVKKANYKKIAAKVVSIAVVIGMLMAYYFHMSDVFSEPEEQENTVQKTKEDKKSKLAKSLEKIIFKESETIVDLIDQRNIQKIMVKGKMLLIICDVDTDIEPLMIRYGVLALIKNTNKDIKIAIELKHIVESRYEKI